MLQVITIHQDDMDDIRIIDSSIDDVTFADEHLNRVLAFNCFGESI